MRNSSSTLGARTFPIYFYYNWLELLKTLFSWVQKIWRCFEYFNSSSIVYCILYIVYLILRLFPICVPQLIHSWHTKFMLSFILFNLPMSTKRCCQMPDMLPKNSAIMWYFITVKTWNIKLQRISGSWNVYKIVSSLSIYSGHLNLVCLQAKYAQNENE